MPAPDPNQPFPVHGQARVGLLKPLVNHELIDIGEYSYYDDPDGPERFVERCVLYHFDFIGDRLTIGRFCAIATGATFIMNGANHAMTGFSTFPFEIFGGDWARLAASADPKAGYRGDTMIGNDVWIGRDATFMPGVTVGDGAIIAAKSVVASDVPPYAVVAGNAGRVIRMRYDDNVIDALMNVAWWNWPIETISENLEAIRGADLAALERIAR